MFLCKDVSLSFSRLFNVAVLIPTIYLERFEAMSRKDRSTKYVQYIRLPSPSISMNMALEVTSALCLRCNFGLCNSFQCLEL